MKYILATFEKTTDAVLFARAAGSLRGRLGPVPRALEVSCGLAWRAPAEEEAALRNLIRDRGLKVSRIVTWEAAS